MTDHRTKYSVFTQHDYWRKPAFASFLPGVAGPLGIPLWVFYVNRGQGIAAFGLGDKNTPIMEFQPFDKACATVPYLGFRTFIHNDGQVHEILGNSAIPGVSRSLKSRK